MLSALDTSTERQVFANLFGTNGLLKQKSVVLVTNDTSRLPQADYIVHLSDGTLLRAGCTVTFDLAVQEVQAIKPRDKLAEVSTSLGRKEMMDVAEVKGEADADGDLEQSIHMRGGTVSSE